MTLFETQELLIRAIKENVEFNEKAVLLLGSSLTYSIDQNEVDSQDVYPILIMHKNANIQDMDEGSQMIFQFIMAAMIGERILSVDDITYYPSVRDIEILSLDAMQIIVATICTNSDYRVAQTNNLITTIGEADDVQSVMSFRLEKNNFI